MIRQPYPVAEQRALGERRGGIDREHPYGAIVLPPAVQAHPSAQPVVRRSPPPLHGGPLTLLRFAREHGMLRPSYVPLVLRWIWLRARWRGRLQTDGLCFVGRGVKLEIGRTATLA